MKRNWLAIILIIMMTAMFSSYATARNTRDLTFEDEPDQASAKTQTSIPQAVVAVKTTIELERNGVTSTVLPTHKFRSGDRVKIVYSTNVDAYVYWISQGTSGDYYMLFPNPKAGTDNFVKKNDLQTIPVKGNFKFSGKAGVEKILLVMSPQRIPELEQASREAAIKGGRIRGEAREIGKVEHSVKSKRKSRDLRYEEDEDEATGVSTHSQTSQDISDPMVVYYELIHQ